MNSLNQSPGKQTQLAPDMAADGCGIYLRSLRLLPCKKLQSALWLITNTGERQTNGVGGKKSMLENSINSTRLGRRGEGVEDACPWELPLGSSNEGTGAGGDTEASPWSSGKARATFNVCVCARACVH